MPCCRPKKLRGPWGATLTVPCKSSRCSYCYERRLQDWKKNFLRLPLNHGYFITLTFKGDPPTLDQANDIWNRFRTNFTKNGRRFRYIRATEAGEKNGRYHFHIIVPVTCTPDLVRQYWQASGGGHTHSRRLGPDAIGYITSYLRKVHAAPLPPRRRQFTLCRSWSYAIRILKLTEADKLHFPGYSYAGAANLTVPLRFLETYNYYFRHYKQLRGPSLAHALE